MKRRRSRGFVSMPAVTVLALMLTLSLLMLYRTGMIHRDHAAKSQLRGDYHQREEGFLRALVTVLPRKAIACMKSSYQPSDEHTWKTIFEESVALAGGAESLSPELMASMGLAAARRGDVADQSAETVSTWITSLSGVVGKVTPGTTEYAGIFSQAQFAGRVPPLLTTSAGLQGADEVMPVISTEKRYGTQDPGLLADVTKYPTYNLIPYPNIRFGYAEPGQPFVAKRNWWAFRVTFGASASGVTSPLPSVEKHYVISLYEIPSQLPIEGAAFAKIGTYSDGAAWDSSMISIDGGVYANNVSMTGSFGAARVTGKESIQMTEPMTLGGSEVGDDFDEPGVREQLQVDRRSDVLPVAVSANAGRLTFLPIQRGSAFLKRSPLGQAVPAWDAYTKGGERCRMTVDAISMVSLEDQTPTAIRIRFQPAGAGTAEVILRRGVNWPTILEPTGDVIPFQTELTDTNHSCLTFYPALLNAWLLQRGGAGVAVNNSICFQTDPTADPLTVLPVSDQPAQVNMAVIVRKGKDLTAFTNGVSLVAPLRVYVGDDLNATSMAAAPAGSGLPAGSQFYPAMSISSAELRIGTTSFNRPFEHHGQMLSLANGGSEPWQPLDVKSGSDDAVHTDTIAAELKPLKSPAELPPIHQMNWLVVIEEIPKD